MLSALQPSLLLRVASFQSLPHFLFTTATATSQIYTLSLHDALPILHPDRVLPAGVLQPLEHLDVPEPRVGAQDRKSTRLNSSHVRISYAVFCFKKKTYVLSASVHSAVWL